VRFASHVNVSVIIAGGYYLAYQYISSLHHIIPSSNISATPLNIPWALTWLLLGTSFVDIDTRIGPGHRTRSPLHKAELPLIICGVCLLLLHLCGISIIQKYLPHIQHLVRVATFFSAGWALHLVGDFIQGGIGSYVFKRKIGLTWLTWDKYDTFWGKYLIDKPLGLGAICILLSTLWLFPNTYFQLPSWVYTHLLSEFKPLPFPWLNAGKIYCLVLWSFLMISNGYKTFLKIFPVFIVIIFLLTKYIN
jgi:hypothetical protein